ncbi:hypothetical protein EDD16DRAFT_1545628 [Pisolithus croceorrhizus]|nr:hypothetical protein EDD16DRAFT_1545628 [Pisolithus croceorrhizus]
MPTSCIEHGSQLSILRIARLTRPLRTKCTALATYIQSTCKSSYPTSATWGRGSAPLSVIMRPARMGRKSQPEHGIVADHELTRHINAVSDAFRNIVVATFGTPCSEHIVSLAAICGSIVGGNIPVTISDFPGNVSLDDSADEDIIRTFAEEIYESVPPHYRRYSLIIL